MYYSVEQPYSLIIHSMPSSIEAMYLIDQKATADIQMNIKADMG